LDFARVISHGVVRQPELLQESAMTRLDRFADLVVRSQFSLAEACLMIAEDAYPALDGTEYMRQLEEIAEVIQSRLPADAFAEQKIAALNAHLFGELGFHGNESDYYDPRNSYLNDVIERRTGLPITLSVVYIEIGRKIGLPLQGVSFPGHFLVKLRLREGQLILDPFQKGAPQSDGNLRKRLANVVPGFDSRNAGANADLGRYLETASPHDIVVRVLRNLKAIHLKAGKLNEALAVMNRILLVAPEAPEELRDRGLVFEQLDCFRPAAADLQNYLRRRPNSVDAPEMRAKLVALRNAASRLN
jgi:regulator of sirC expression with transglutaminase-like and TPR domain